jgi:hypothetical protein
LKQFWEEFIISEQTIENKLQDMNYTWKQNLRDMAFLRV